MKILFVTMQYGPGYYQGTERYIQNLSVGLKEIGNDIVILAGDPERKWSSRYHGLGDKCDMDGNLHYHPSFGWMTVCGAKPGDMQGFLKKHQPDVVHLVNPAHIGLNMLNAAKAQHIPTVVTIVDYWWFCPQFTLIKNTGEICSGNAPPSECVSCIAGQSRQPLARQANRYKLLKKLFLPILFFANGLITSGNINQYARWTNRFTLIDYALAHADHVICLSQVSRSLLQRHYNVQEASYIPVGLKKEWTLSEEITTVRSRDTDSNMPILYVGTIAPHKGLHILLEALRKLRFAPSLHVAGDYSDSDYFREISALSRSLRVSFLGPVEESSIREQMAQACCLVVPSLWLENQPQVIWEAQSQGLPVVASDLGGCQEAIADKRLLFRAGDVMDLARVLQEVLQNGHHYQLKLPYHYGIMAERTAAIYRKLISNA